MTPVTMTTFNDMGLPEGLQHTLKHMKFETPTPIQLEAVPAALKGHDVLGTARTGTGKTGAFGIPLVAHLLNNPQSTALVMTPTRELATQVMTQLRVMLGRRTKIRTALLIGGEPMGKQFSQLNQRPRLVVGTPGRINDHLKRESVNFSQTDFLVLDETDRMLDMGFTSQIELVLGHLAEVRQTLLFSATLPKNIEKMAAKYLNDPVRIAVSPTSSPAANISQETVRISQEDKYARLLEELNGREGSVIVFVKTKYGTEKMAKKLKGADHLADAIHGDLRQSRRDRVIRDFRSKKYRILVATDVAARGLDIPHIEHVINYDLPQAPEDYIHRIGRTARAGAEGAALNFVSPADNGKWAAIDQLLNPGKKPERAEKAGGKPGGRKRKPNRRTGSKAKASGHTGSKQKGENRASETGKPAAKPFAKRRRNRPGKTDTGRKAA